MFGGGLSQLLNSFGNNESWNGTAWTEVTFKYNQIKEASYGSVVHQPQYSDGGSPRKISTELLEWIQVGQKLTDINTARGNLEVWNLHNTAG